jgi:hypothetical protein
VTFFAIGRGSLLLGFAAAKELDVISKVDISYLAPTYPVLEGFDPRIAPLSRLSSVPHSS